MSQEDQKDVSSASTTPEPTPLPPTAESSTEGSPSSESASKGKFPTSPTKAGIQIVLRPIHLIIAVICTVAIIAGGVVLGIQINKWMVDPDIDPNAQKYPYPGVTDVAEDQIAVPGYSTIRFPADTQKVNIVLPNPDENPCYFVFSIVLAETGEVLYRSGMVPPGMALTEITLSRPLESGTYSIDIRIETFSLTDKSPMNGANVQATLVVS
jgi:hypothetical protein